MHYNLRKNIVIITILLILGLLFIQVRWIGYSIKFQDTAFKKSINLALNQTISHLTKNKQVCYVINECVNCDSLRLETQLLSTGVWDMIHTAVDKELKAYEIDLDYDLFIIETRNDSIQNIIKERTKKGGFHYSQCIGEIISRSGYELVVLFPSRTRFFLEKVGFMFLASVVLILMIIGSFFYLLKLYKIELRLVEHTKELINNVSHEFKTPLSSISLASGMIRKGRYSSEEKLVEYATLIFKENKKLQRQVESLLHLAAIERNEFEYEKKEIGISEIIEEATNTVEMLLIEKDGNLKIENKAKDAMVLVDKIHLSNAIVNLLSNAIKYSKDKPEIKITTFRENKKVGIEVEDKGIGIPSKYVKYIFNKYYRVPTGDIHNIKGFGIGLSYVKRVVKAHGGDVKVNSTLGEGSVFTIILPEQI